MKMQMVPVRLRRAGQLAQRLRHQPRLQADVGVAHLALELGLGHQRRHRVDHHHVDRVASAPASRRSRAPARRCRAATPAGCRCRRRALGVLGVERVLGVDEGREPAARCAWATTWSASVVLPEDSGPKISTTRPRGSRRCRSRCRARASRWGSTRCPRGSRSPRRMIAPLPNCRSIWLTAASSAWSRSISHLSSGMLPGRVCYERMFGEYSYPRRTHLKGRGSRFGVEMHTQQVQGGDGGAPAHVAAASRPDHLL